MAERILILGAGVMQGPAILAAKDMGLEAVVIDANPGAENSALADRFECIDLKDREGIERFGRTLMESGGLSGIMTAGTDFSASVAWAAERLGLPGIPYEAALDASDKERMRRRFREAGVASPDFLTLTEIPDEEYVLPFSYPAVVKPVDNMGSRGCRRADSGSELKDAVEEALSYSRSGRVIVEEFMDGPEYSVDALVFHGEITICGLADRHIYFSPYFIEMGHTMPSSLDSQEAAELLELFKAGIRALGIENGAAKGDVKRTASGPMIGEIAARLSGGYMSGWTYPYASGVHPVKGAIQIAMGRKPEGLEPLLGWTSAERAFISIPGKVRSVSGVEEARKMPHVKELFLHVREGSSVCFPENNVSKCGNIISAAPSREEAAGAAEEAARSVLIRLEVPNMETEDFLAVLSNGSRHNIFPPDAFILPEHIRSLLMFLPEPDFEVPPDINGTVYLLAFPDFTESGLSDYMGRTVKESLEAVRKLTGLPLPMTEEGAYPGSIILGRNFWTAMVRGGYQGAAYVVDRAAGKLNGLEE